MVDITVTGILSRIWSVALFGVLVACSQASPTVPSAVLVAQPDTALQSLAATPAHVLRPVEFGMIQGQVVFPPRNEPNTFFQNLQALYRDTLRRSQTTTYVDAEGQNVWLTEYFRFYLNGCSHQESMARTLQEISTGATLSTCGSEVLTFPPRNLPNEFQAQLEVTYRDVLRRPQVESYVDSEGANVWMAQYLRLRTSGQCSHAMAESKVFEEIRGGGVQADCAPQVFSLTGVLTDSSGTVVTDATISIVDGQFAGQSTTTDRNGSFTLTRVSGTFTIRASRSGFETVSRTVTVTQNTRFDFVLTRTQIATPTPTTRTRIGAVCRDGSLSNATGSGACSSHGGVSCWRYNDGSCTNP